MVVDVGKIKGQVSVELLIILGFFMIILIPLIVFAFDTLTKENWKISLQRDRDVLKGLATSANELVMIGKNNSAKYTAYFSSGVKNLTSIGNVLILKEEIPYIGEIDQVVILERNITLKHFECNGVCVLKETNTMDVKGLNVFKLTYDGKKIIITKEE